GQVTGEVRSRRRVCGIGKRRLDIVCGAEVCGRERGDQLIGNVVQDGVLSLCASSIVEPALGVLCLRREIPSVQIIVLAQLSRPSLTQGFKDKVANIEILRQGKSAEACKFGFRNLLTPCVWWPVTFEDLMAAYNPVSSVQLERIAAQASL